MAAVKVGTCTVYSAAFLGRGSFGEVFTATDVKGYKRAAKRIDRAREYVVQKISKDVDKMLALDHSNVVKIFDIHQVGSTIWMFMELCQFGDLKSFTSKHGLTENQKLKLMQEIALGVEYLHANHVIHRDIKPANILIANYSPIVGKLTDFDLSKFLEPNYATSLMMTVVGTRAFQAPEFFQRNKQGAINYHRNIDVFALALTYLTMVQGNEFPRIETPNSESDLHAPIGQIIAERIKYNFKPLEVIPRQDETLLVTALATTSLRHHGHEMHSNMRELIRRMTHHVPERRIPAEEVVRVLHTITPVGLE